MNLIAVSIAGIAAGTTVLLLTRRSNAAHLAPRPSPTNPMSPLPISYGEATPVSLSVPNGWRRATNAEVAALPELGAAARALREVPGFSAMPYGTLQSFSASDGNRYATWIEQHYHPPGGPAKPWGLHHGVTLLAEIRTPPALAGYRVIG